ncbi:unnamed protein product [Prorocentrum cordatum]|uniref:Transmembrane protein n=1 Tax=Prorocentrum cordatum TaxID=2364126 RepID=A0ABN9U6K5_9DINO|nr:unnamed protein product [Polarella glacialis]
MFRYECCFSSGRQFVFTERKGWPIGERQLALCLASLLAGVYLFFFISFAGVAAFEVVMLCLASCAARSAYVWSFHGSSNTVDHLVYVVMVGIFTGVLLVFLSSVRLLLSLETSAANRCMLFSVSIMIMGFLTYSYLTIACSEDERKHQIRPCTQEGCTLQTMELSCHGEGPKDNGRDVYGRFLKWIVSWRWWTDVQDHSATAEDERRQSDAITVHNHSLKLIKVCFYSPADLVCWVPFGGVSGRCVGLVDAGRSRSFHFPRADGDDGGGPYRLKVFQPRLLDKELACFPQAQRGQNLAFFDVEGTVRRSRLLSNSTCRSLSISTCLPESSEDEAAPTSPGTPTTAGSPGSDDASAGRPTPAQAKHGSTSDLGPPRRGAGGGPFRRQVSRDNLGGGPFRRQVSGDSLGDSPFKRQPSGDDLGLLALERSRSDDHPGASASEAARPQFRRAGPDEVVVCNRSSQEICARLFRSNDYCYLVPLVGKLAACGDTILPDCERRFNPPTTSDRDFTLKVYSVGAGARELTYLTASRGHAYTFCDSLLS